MVKELLTENQHSPVLVDILKKRKKRRQTVISQIRARQAERHKSRRKHLISPDTLIKQYRAQAKSHAYFRLRVSFSIQKAQVGRLPTVQQGSRGSPSPSELTGGTACPILVVRVRGVKDVSRGQKRVLRELGVERVGHATLVRGSPEDFQRISLVRNYITWGEASRATVEQLIYRRLFAKMDGTRVRITSNQQVEEHFGGKLLSLEELVGQIHGRGEHFEEVRQFAMPFRLTFPEDLLQSRLRKPVEAGGHWGPRGSAINEYVSTMI